MTSLIEFADRFTRRLDATPGWIARIKTTARKLAYWHMGRHSADCYLADLTEDLVSDYVAHALRRWARPTVKTERAAILQLWAAAARQGLARKPDREYVRNVKLPEPCPSAWTYQQVELLLEIAERMEGRMTSHKYSHRGWRIPRAEFWRAAILFGYDTALRRGDCLRATLDHVNWPQATIRLVQSKTGKSVTRPLSRLTLDALRNIPHPHGLLLPWPGRIWSFSATFRRELVERADLPGSWLWLRRTSATEVAYLSPGAESQALGHADGRCKRHYLDRSRESPGVLPPPLLAG